MGKDKKKETTKEQDEEEAVPAVAQKPDDADADDDDDSDSYVSSEEEAEDLVLEGVLRRNPDASDSSSDSDDDEDSDDSNDDDDNEEDEEDTKPPPAKKSKGNDKEATTKKNNNNNNNNNNQKQQKKKKKGKKKKESSDELGIVPVEFTFCDMDEKFFHGLKALLTSTSPIYAAHSSELSDLMIENASIGTIVGCEEGGDPDTVFGFASVLNVATMATKNNNNNNKGDKNKTPSPSIQALTKICLDQCPASHKSELQTVLSGKTKRPAGFYLHGRMVNLPLEIVEVLHQQLVLDMDWAVEKAENVNRKSLDYGAFVRLAPSYRSGGGGGSAGQQQQSLSSSSSSSSLYKYFDDEVFADHAEFVFEIKIPKTFGMEETPYCMVIVMTKTGHQAAMKAMSKMVNGASA